MGFEISSKIGFTIYSKSGCTNCLKVKALLKEKEIYYKVINCDEYLIEDKDLFLSYIETLANKPYRMFPMVFLYGSFIGGYEETKTHIEKMNVTFEENLDF